MSRAGAWWRGKSTPAKVETYTRWSFHFFAVIEIAAIGLPVLSQAGSGIGGWLLVMVGAHAVVCGVAASLALDWTRGRRDQPVRLLWALAAFTFVLANIALAVQKYGPSGDDVDTAAGTLFTGVLIFGAGAIALGVRNRRRVVAIVVGFGLGAAAVSFPLGMPGPAALGVAFAVLVGAGFMAFTSVFSVWLLNAVYALDEARETRARLAVAEERLRFGRDLHDVMGRNLAVIALKSELAVQLARRERPEAVDQMIEVQRIARESQREVRDVVRGYREADLDAELIGAQGVLTAAGIACEVSGEATGLPAGVQSALGWVVREAATNVLRHGNAERCAVTLRVAEGRVVLTVENDGVRGVGEGRGSGLAGLRERLSAIGGVLRAGPVGDGPVGDGGGVFRLTAEVPVPESLAETKPLAEPKPGSVAGSASASEVAL